MLHDIWKLLPVISLKPSIPSALCNERKNVHQFNACWGNDLNFYRSHNGDRLVKIFHFIFSKISSSFPYIDIWVFMSHDHMHYLISQVFHVLIFFVAHLSIQCQFTLRCVHRLYFIRQYKMIFFNVHWRVNPTENLTCAINLNKNACK